MSVTWNTDADMTPAQAQAEKAAKDQLLWAVRDALRAAGATGLTTGELYAIGTSAVRRLNELKRLHGYDYTRAYVRAGTWRYVLIEPCDVAPVAKAPITSRMVSEAGRILASAARARRHASLPATEPRPGSLFQL